MGKAQELEKKLANFEDGSTKDFMNEIVKSVSGLETEMEQSKELIAKQKEELTKMGIDPETATPETIKMIKSIKEGGQATEEGNREDRLKALGGMLGAFAGAKNSKDVAKQTVSGWEAMARTNEQKEFVKSIAKAVESTTFEGGAAVVSPVYSNDFVMALRDQIFLSKLGLRRVNFVGGEYIIGKHNAGVTGAYVGETKKISKDQPKFGNIVLKPKKAGVIVPIANEWLTNADAGAFQNVTLDAINAMEELMGQTFLEGSGTQYTPQGLSKMAGNSTNTAGTTVANIITDLLYGRKTLTANKIQIRKPALIMNPAQETHLMGLRDSDGWVFRDEMLTGRLFGAPYYATTAATVSSSKSKLYYLDADKIYEASNKSLTMAQSDAATYTDANGVSVNAFEQDMSIMRLIYAHDFGTQYENAIAIVEQVAWGN